MMGDGGIVGLAYVWVISEASHWHSGFKWEAKVKRVKFFLFALMSYTYISRVHS